jgi:hypothetical protein
MGAEAIRQVTEAPARAEYRHRTRASITSRSRVIRLPGPEVLLHPRAAEALVLAFRPLSWTR